MSGELQHVRHEAAHAVVAWRSNAAEVVSIAMRWPPHVRMYTRRGWNAGMEDAVIAAVGQLAEDPTAYDDYGAFRSAQLLTDAHLVLSACSLLGQRGHRKGQKFWFDFVRDEALERLAMYRDDIDLVAAALTTRGALDHDDLARCSAPRSYEMPRTPRRGGRSRRDLHRPRGRPNRAYAHGRHVP